MLRAYVKRGFEVFDHIKFTVLDAACGVDSIAIHHQGITGTHVAEVLFFDKDGMVRESYVHHYCRRSSVEAHTAMQRLPSFAAGR